MPMPELYGLIVDWAVRHGATKIDTLDGLWIGETDEYRIAINGHQEEVDLVPPLCIKVEHKTYLALAIIAPSGGETMIPEADLIEHFQNAA